MIARPWSFRGSEVDLTGRNDIEGNTDSCLADPPDS